MSLSFLSGGDSLKNFVDSKVYRYMEWCYRCMVLNTFFIITSIPIFSIGASSAALFTVIGKLRKGEEFHWREYFKYFRKNFAEATKVWIIILAFIVILAFNFMNAEVINPLLGIVQIFIGFQLILITIYSFKLISKFELKPLQVIKNAWIIGNRFIGHSIGVLVLFYIALKISMRVPVFMLFFYFSFTHIILDMLVQYIIDRINIYRGEVV